MFPLLMTHPQHGATHAFDQSEAEWLKKQGWQEPKEEPKEEPKPKVKRAYHRKAA